MSIKLSLHYDPINESNTFTSGDIVEGRIVLEVAKEINVDHFFVKLTGDANVHWVEGGSNDQRTYSDFERYFKLKQYLIQENSKKGQQEENSVLIGGNTYGSVLKPGSYVFPFRFQLPQQNMPASFSALHGWVTYTLTAKLKRPWKPTSSTNTKLTFVPRNYVISDHLLQPQSRKEEKKMTLFGSGKMSMAVSTEKTVYMQGETIRVYVDVDNSSSRNVKLKYSLWQQQTFIAGKNKTRGLKNILKETKNCISSGEKNKFPLDIKLPHDMMVTIENCRILKVEYTLKVYLDVSFAFDPEVKFPVVIIPPWQDPPLPYLPPQPNFAPYPVDPPPLYPNQFDPSVLPHPGAAAGVYPDPNAVFPGFHPAPSAPVYDPNQSTK